jgi:cytochrome b6-f complex iron-sulfur subunit
MAKRTPEEIKAQREAWLAKKAAREAGLEVPAETPSAPDDAEPEKSTEAKTPEPAAATSPEPKSPKKKRTPEEIKAQREAFLAAKAARAAGASAPAAPTEKPAEPAKPQVEPAKATAKTAPAKAAKPSKPAAARKSAPPPAETDPNLTRREFLNYAWLASIAVFSVGTIGASLWFAFPNFKAGEFGGEFQIGQASNVLPEVNTAPVAYTNGKFWLSNVDTEVDGEPRKGVLAIYKVCTHLGCLYEWIPMTDRFECPCHGSKFQLTGDYIAGPARRNLDRFVIKAVAPDGTVKETDAEGHPLVVEADDLLIIDTGQRILGSSDITPA